REMEGVECNDADGAMYAFPRISLPPRFVQEASRKGVHPDSLYSLLLLEETGIVVVPGNGFGQRDGTFHFRTTILPPENKLSMVITKLKAFHAGLMKRYKS